MRIMKVIFATVGTLAALLGIGTIAMAAAFYTPGASGRAAWGGLLYPAVAAVCFYAFLRLNRSRGSGGG